jgi:competence protein ComEA
MVDLDRPASDRGAEPPAWRERLELIARGEPFAPSRLLAMIAGLALLVFAGWFLLRDPPAPVESTLPIAGGGDDVAATPASTTTTAPAELVVHASGAVGRPGIYRVPKAARVADVVTAAGGTTDGADLDRLNLAAPVVDGAQVRVPRVGEPAPSSSASSAASDGAPPSGPVNLNTASPDELESLPGIGPATAASIVEARTRRPFRRVDDLLDVPGIGPAKLDQVRGLVTV